MFDHLHSWPLALGSPVAMLPSGGRTAFLPSASLASGSEPSPQGRVCSYHSRRKYCKELSVLEKPQMLLLTRATALHPLLLPVVTSKIKNDKLSTALRSPAAHFCSFPLYRRAPLALGPWWPLVCVKMSYLPHQENLSWVQPRP